MFKLVPFGKVWGPSSLQMLLGYRSPPLWPYWGVGWDGGELKGQRFPSSASGSINVEDALCKNERLFIMGTNVYPELSLSPLSPFLNPRVRLIEINQRRRHTDLWSCRWHPVVQCLEGTVGNDWLEVLAGVLCTG